MTDREFAADMLARLPFSPNEQQLKVALALARFCAPQPSSPDAPTADRVFVLNGYAGTGKTSLVGALVKSLKAAGMETVLLAPTGRAAKVFAQGAGTAAYTIHRKIYRHALGGESTSFAHGGVPQENKHTNTVFIVDEASMIGSETETGSNLLSDLIQFVYSGPGCRLILLGDTAQLPPVGQSDSPAMESEHLRGYGLKVTRATMTEVVRQAHDSGILHNATRLRKAMQMAIENPAKPPLVPIAVSGRPDITVVEADELPEVLDSLYGNDGPEDTIVITRSNKTACDFNQGIREIVLGREEELAPGDLLIAAKNNYFWTRKVKGLDFIANGEVLRLVRILSTETHYGLRFADVTVEPADTPGLEFEAKIVLNSLRSSEVALDYESRRLMYEGAYADPTLAPPEADHATRIRAMRKSPHCNALQVKYAYAVTCHKAQGGQWKNVLVDLSYIPPDQLGPDFYRWLYTAVTRARAHLFLINPPEVLVR